MKRNHKLFFIIATLFTVTSWGLAIYFWDKLPAVIPIHFGFDGQANGWADKSLFYVFLMPVIQSLILGLFIFIYYKPQYSNIPSTMWLTMLNKEQKDYAYELMRNMNTGILILINILFTYMTYIMNAVAINTNLNLSPYSIMLIIITIVLWSIIWTVIIYKAVKNKIKN